MPRPNARPYKNPGKMVIAVALSLLIYAVFFAGCVLLAMLFLFQETQYGIWFLGALVCWVVLLFTRYLHAHSCICPLCRGPLMRKQNCGMHERARRHLGFHYRTSMLIDIIVHWWFCCPYCGTHFRMKR